MCGIVLLAATLQRTVGFGFALIALPLMAFALPTKTAVVVVILIGAVTSAWLAARLRHDVELPTTRLLAVGTLAGAPVGVAVL
ncbi:MAG TPA: TSUP family transporter, partial [Acidimicrobiales bacterium]|nr:TSUP family transporter [Acidimicrobiales bacterium]